MSYIKKPNIFRNNAPKNELGMTYTDYEGAMSTLCAGCGHDSITGAIIQSVFVIEQNRDGQLLKLLKTETSCDVSKLKSIRLYNGIPIFPKDVVSKIMEEISSGKAA